MNKFDLIIIGGGAGGVAAAIKANELEAKTLIINDGLPLGGTCVNVGCVPSKVLLWAGEIMHLAKNHGIPGLKLEIKNFDFSKIIRDELNLVETLRREKYQKVLTNLSNVKLINGRGSFTSNNTIEVNGEIYRADKFIIATGSTARIPDISELKEVGYLTHIEALNIKNQPKELIIMGGGPVALEFAQIYSRFGSKVTILQRSERIFEHGEFVLIDKLSKIFKKENIDIKTNIEVKKVCKNDGKKTLICEQNGNKIEISADEILVAIGKIPNISGLNLDKIGVSLSKHQSIEVQPNFQTSQKHIYAIGDVANLPLRLETTAGAEGSFAALNAIKGEGKTIDYNTVPYTVFTDPQIAGVGLTEEQQIQKIGSCACRTVTFDKIPKAIIIRHTDGMIKMAIHPKTKEIMGVHILAPNAGELIAQAMILVKNKNTIDDVINSLPVFPTLSEAIKLVAVSFYKDINKLSCCV